MTVEEFDQFAALPANQNKRLEYVGGEVSEVVSNSYSSEIAANVLAEIRMFVKGQKLGRVTGADGGYRVMGERYIPDAGFISFARQPQSSHEAYTPNPPDLAVEVLSPSDDPVEMRIKIVNYLRAGTTVWLVNPERKHVEIYAPDQAPLMVGIDGVIDGGTVLPGFRLAVRDIFPDEG